MIIKMIGAAILTLTAFSVFAGEGVTTIDCAGGDLVITIWQAQGGDSSLKIVQEGGKQSLYAVAFGEKQDTTKVGNLTAVIDLKNGKMNVTGSKASEEGVNIKAIPSSIQMKGNESKFSSILSGRLPDGKSINKLRLGCKSKFEI